MMQQFPPSGTYKWKLNQRCADLFFSNSEVRVRKFTYFELTSIIHAVIFLITSLQEAKRSYASVTSLSFAGKLPPKPERWTYRGASYPARQRKSNTARDPSSPFTFTGSHTVTQHSSMSTHEQERRLPILELWWVDWPRSTNNWVVVNVCVEKLSFLFQWKW